jgi:hypothetical protein
MRAARRIARRDTRKRLRKARPGATITHCVWGYAWMIDAYTELGWHPVSEAPRIDLATGDEWTETTLKITKGK